MLLILNGGKEKEGHIPQTKQPSPHKSMHIFRMKPVTAVTHMISILLCAEGIQKHHGSQD